MKHGFLDYPDNLRPPSRFDHEFILRKFEYINQVSIIKFNSLSKLGVPKPVTMIEKLSVEPITCRYQNSAQLCRWERQQKWRAKMEWHQ